MQIISIRYVRLSENISQQTFSPSAKINYVKHFMKVKNKSKVTDSKKLDLTQTIYMDVVQNSHGQEWLHFVTNNNLPTISQKVKVVKLATVVESDQKALFSIATTLKCRGGHYSFPWIASLYL